MEKTTMLAAVSAAAVGAAAPDTTAAAQPDKASVDAARAEGETAGRAAGRADERARCKAILGAEQAAGREDLARYFAFDTDMPADQAVAALGKAPTKAAGSRLAAEMTREQNPALGAGGTTAAAPTTDFEAGAAAAQRFGKAAKKA